MARGGGVRPLIASWLFALACVGQGPLTAGAEQSQGDVTYMLLSLSFGVRKEGGDFVSEVSSISPGLLPRLYGPLLSRLTALDPEIPTTLAFVHERCRLQSDDVGHFCGNFARPLSEPKGGFLFVTTPISQRADAALVIISSVSPERTRILTLGTGG